MDKYKDYVGKVLDKRYRILDVVGVGGMAVVLKAEDLVMNRLVALKILSSDLNGDKAMEQRFINESKAVAMASHKNIVSIYDVAIFTDMKYIVMEFLDGITLKEYIDGKGRLLWKEATFYAIQILRALEHAHSKGIVHRDIKPQNIMLNKSGEIKVTDFGIAKLPNASALTVAEKAIGTVYYISPEQASGKPTDFRADLYSVGILLYEMATGRLPFVHENALNVAMMQVNNIPVEPIKVTPDIPEGLNQIILKAMEKDPSARFPSAHSMLKALELLYNNPELVFTSGSAEAALPPNTVNLNSIATASIGEIVPFSNVDTAIFENQKSQKQTAEESSKEGKNKNKKKKEKRSIFTGSSHSMFPIITGIWLAAMIVMVALGIFFFKAYFMPMFIDNDNKADEVYIPDLVGRIYDDELKAELLSGAGRGEDNGIQILEENVSVVYSNKPKNEIIQQSKHGSVIRPDGNKYYTGLTIVISKGPRVSVYEDQLLMTKSYVESKFNSWGVSDIIIENVGPEYGNTNKISKTDMEHATTNQVLRVEYADTGVELKAGDLIEEGSKIRLYVFVPNSETKMPELLGLTEAEARKALGAVGLTVGEVTERLSDEENGVVIEQAYEEGEVVPVGTVVDFVISKQRPKLIMPNLIGLTIDEAENALLRANISEYTFVYEETEDEEPDIVIDQSFEPDEEIPAGEIVEITVSRSPVVDTSSDSGINSADE